MPDAPIEVTVAFSPAPREVREWELRLPVGSTVADAIGASGLRGEFPALDFGALALAVWGRKASLQQPLRDGDRVEAYRPLMVDPKVARRERFRRQGARAAGLFKKR
jgi:uncharacterized protein